MRNLKKLREEKGLNQIDMAGELNMPQSTYQQYEAGISEPKFETLIFMANHFNTSVDFLIDRTNIREPMRPINEEISFDLTYLKNDKAKKALLSLLKEIRQEGE